jgi:uncharacterized protein (DUF1015 family)
VARFRPFRGVRFSKEAVDSFESVVAPPYDVISPEERDRMIESGKFNSTRLILNPAGHDAAAALFHSWLSDGILRREETPAFYLYRQDFDCDGPKSRLGVIGALHLEPFSTGVVRPHEQTFAHHKQDRLTLTKKVRANLSPIFGLFSNPVFSPEPDGGWDEAAEVDVEFGGVRSRLWVVKDPRNVDSITRAVADRTVFIADGHHRYETALNYHAFLTDGAQLPSGEDAPDDDHAPAAHVMAFLGAFEDPGMVILPTHRELKDLGGATSDDFVGEIESRFSVERMGKGTEAKASAMRALADVSYDENAFVLAIHDQNDYFLVRRPAPSSEGDSVVASLDVSALHGTLLVDALRAAGGEAGEIRYSADADEVFDHVESGEAMAAFFMRPMLAEQMAASCMAGELMPQKSTYFYPKLLTGLAFHLLEN